LSDLDEPRIRCPSCGKNVPAMKYCIYCGAKLPPAPPSVARPTAPAPAPAPARPTPTTVPPPFPPTVPPPAPPSPQVVAPPVSTESEIVNLMSGITSLYERKTSLLDIFQAGAVSEKVFLKLYNEYTSKLADLQNTRIRKMEELRGRLDDRNKRLNEVVLSLEELEVRYKIGELDLSAFSQRAEKLRTEERDLRDAVKSLRMNVEHLEKMLGGKKPREVHDFEMKTKMSYEALQKRVEEGKISVETLNNLKSDVDEMVTFFDSLIRDRKENEKDLREQLETLQTRYKLSEVSVEEYERRKREMQDEIDKVWT